MLTLSISSLLFFTRITIKHPVLVPNLLLASICSWHTKFFGSLEFMEFFCLSLQSHQAGFLSFMCPFQCDFRRKAFTDQISWVGPTWSLDLRDPYMSLAQMSYFIIMSICYFSSASSLSTYL